MYVIISGPGGVGKGTVVARLLELEPGLQLSRSWTTRPRRPGEPEDAYVFVDRDTFEERVGRGGFLEWTEFPGTGHLYGTPARDGGEEDHDVTILEIEIDGAQQIKRSNPDALMVLMVAPSPEAQQRRLRGRGDDDASVARRLAVGEQEEHVGREMADYVVVNDDVDRAAAEVAGIIQRRRMMPGRP